MFLHHMCICQVIVQEGGMKRDLVVGVVRAKHDVHKAAGEVRHTVGYHACNGNIVFCDASDKQHVIEGTDFSHQFSISLFRNQCNLNTKSFHEFLAQEVDSFCHSSFVFGKKNVSADVSPLSLHLFCET